MIEHINVRELGDRQDKLGKSSIVRGTLTNKIRGK
jgi:hypothetical protein